MSWGGRIVSIFIGILTLIGVIEALFGSVDENGNIIASIIWSFGNFFSGGNFVTRGTIYVLIVLFMFLASMYMIFWGGKN